MNESCISSWLRRAQIQAGCILLTCALCVCLHQATMDEGQVAFQTMRKGWEIQRFWQGNAMLGHFVAL